MDPTDSTTEAVPNAQRGNPTANPNPPEQRSLDGIPRCPATSPVDSKTILADVDGEIQARIKGFLLRHFSFLDPETGGPRTTVSVSLMERIMHWSKLPTPAVFSDPADALWCPQRFLVDKFLPREWHTPPNPEDTEKQPDDDKTNDNNDPKWHTFREPAAYPQQPSDDFSSDHLLFCLKKPKLTKDMAEAEKESFWSDVQVIGHFCKKSLPTTCTCSYRNGFLRLSRYAREVFAFQPLRLFLHGFYIHGGQAEFWIFDRSGPYGCDMVFNLKNHDGAFRHICHDYDSNKRTELGNTDFVEYDAVGPHVKDWFVKYKTIQVAGEKKVTKSQEIKKFYLQFPPIARSKDGIVGTGTTCYRARTNDSKRWDHVIKFKWLPVTRAGPSEWEIFELIQKRTKSPALWGVVAMDSYRTEIASTARFRTGLQFGSSRRFIAAPETQTETESSEEELLRIECVEKDMKILKEKVKLLENMMNMMKLSEEGKEPLKKEAATTETKPEAKPSDEDKAADLPSTGTSIVDSTEETGHPYVNRELTYIVLSPAGRPLRTFKNRLELLEVLCDAMRGHQTLFQDAKILHQDVSADHIIITDHPSKNGPHGFLIDLHNAKDLGAFGSKPSHKEEMIGTRAFMALGLLHAEPHSYRHDLESFFYVLLWTIIANRAENVPKTSKLRRWVSGSWDGSTAAKMLDMEKHNFQKILDEFGPEFHCLRPLASSLRDHLFAYPTLDCDEHLWICTDTSPEAVNWLYAVMIGEFTKAIKAESAFDGTNT